MNPPSADKALRVLELYSGIGGMHFALKECGVNFEVVAAVDINNVANDIYRHNFPGTNLLQRGIESFTVKQLDKMSIDLITMSPPCQPFTRYGNQKDNQDQRTKSFFHFLSILEKLERKPDYILLENVKGFDGSVTHKSLLESLTTCNYQFQQFLLTPLQFGIPNSRLRYFLLAKQCPLTFSFTLMSTIQSELPACADTLLTHKRKYSENEHTVDNRIPQPGTSMNNLSKNTNNDCVSQPDAKLREVATCNATSTVADTIPAYVRYASICSPLEGYLENVRDVDLEQYQVSDKLLTQFWVMDIVYPKSTHSCCFTKRYAHHIEGAGSVLQEKESNVDLITLKHDRKHTPEIVSAVRSLGLRFFTPREISNLMCFPKDFTFPDGQNTMQCYRALGNSLNVHCVSVLMSILLDQAGCS